MNIYDEVDPTTLDLFRAYHRENPEIWPQFKKFAFEMLNSGRKRYSAKSIMERIRWDFEIKNSDRDFKVDNNFTAIYARVLVHRFPEFADFFEFRHLTGIKRAA